MSGSRKSTIEDEGDLRKYFAMIPHLVNGIDLDPYAYRVYGYLKHEAGQDPEIEVSTREIARGCKMSPARVVTAKRHLVDANLIQVDARGEGRRDHITILDIWRENFLRHAPPDKSERVDRSGGEHYRLHSEHQRSGDERTVQVVNTSVQVVNTSPEVETDKKNKRIKTIKRIKKNEMNEGTDVRAAEDSFIHSFAVDPLDAEKSFMLLTDAEVGLDEPKACELAATYGFEAVERQVFAWRDETGDYTGLGALITRFERNFNVRPLTAKQKATELYRRHHPEYEGERASAYTQPPTAPKKNYRPDEYADIIL